MVGTIEEQHDPIHQIGTSNVMTDTPSIVVTETDTNVNHSNADSVMSYGSIENQPVALDEEQSAVFLKKDETIIRDKSKHNIFYLLLINTYSSVRVFTGHLITLESLISVGLSVGFTLFVYDKIQNDNELKSIFNGSVMSWTLLSFAIITPISAAVTMAFRRRELALTQIITVRSTLLCLYTSHCVWDWDWKKNIHNDGFDITTGRQRVKFSSFWGSAYCNRIIFRLTHHILLVLFQCLRFQLIICV